MGRGYFSDRYFGISRISRYISLGKNTRGLACAYGAARTLPTLIIRAIQYEVDIVLERDNHQIIGIEIKASATVTLYDFKGLIKLSGLNPSKFQYGVLFYSGKEILPFLQGDIKLFAVPIGLFIGA